MTFCRLLLPLFLVAVSAAASEQNTTSAQTRERLKARLAEEAARKPAAATPAPKAAVSAPAPAATSQSPAPASQPLAEQNPILASPAPASPAARAAAAESDKEAKAKARAEPPTMMPKMEVRRSRITELDRQLAKQEKEIEREKKNTKPTEVDKALNDSKIARPLAIFGGESAEFRQRVASERVGLMEDEKDLIEAIARAKTKEEKASLQRQLDLVRAQRRELDRSLR